MNDKMRAEHVESKAHHIETFPSFQNTNDIGDADDSCEARERDNMCDGGDGSDDDEMAPCVHH